MSVRSECGLILANDLSALLLSSIPTPPTAAPALFLVAEVVISVLPKMISYFTGSSWTMRCSCIPIMSILHLIRLVTSSSLHRLSLIVLTFMVDIVVLVLHVASGLLLRALPLSLLRAPSVSTNRKVWPSRWHATNMHYIAMHL